MENNIIELNELYKEIMAEIPGTIRYIYSSNYYGHQIYTADEGWVNCDAQGRDENGILIEFNHKPKSIILRLRINREKGDLGTGSSGVIYLPNDEDAELTIKGKTINLTYKLRKVKHLETEIVEHDNRLG